LSKTNSIIEVNGNRYDALSGQLLNAGERMKQTTAASKKRVIDGFTIGAHHSRAKLKTKNLSKANKTPAHTLHQRPQRAKTLVRSGVAKPAGPSSAAPQAPKNYAQKINPVRDLRARTIAKHQAVRRFGNFSSRPLAADITAPRPKPALKAAVAEIVAPASRMPSMITSVSHQKIEKMLDEALLKADAHKHMMNQTNSRGLLGRAKSAPRWLSFGVSGLILIVAAAFLIWRNLPAVAVHLASAKAGVHASIPAYTPSGFSYAHLQYKPGAITMQFNDKTEPAQKFVLTQQTSNWSSASLESNALPKNANVQTSEVNGTTVYIYGQSNDATWVNNNVRYSLKNQANLSSDQVLKIVQSL
jgi:hypothetical protein